MRGVFLNFEKRQSYLCAPLLYLNIEQIMKVSLQKPCYVLLVILVSLCLCYMDLMLRLSLQYDIMDVEDIIGPGVTLVYRLCSARIVLSILIIILIIVQIFEFRPNYI